MQGLAFSTNAFKKYTLDEAISCIATAGYRGIELMADLPHIDPRRFDQAARTRLKSRLNQLALTVSNVNAFTYFIAGDTYHPTWIEDDRILRQTRVDHTIAAIELAADVGARTVSIQPGGPLIGTSLTPDDAAQQFAAGLRQVLPVARERNVIIAVEPEPGLLIESSKEYAAFKNTFFADEPLIRMNCDIGHLFCVGEDPAGVIRNLPREVAHMHLEDIAKNRVHQHLAPGKGAIDFRSVFDALRSVDYQGWVTVELYPYETTAANVAKSAWHFLQPLLDA